VPLVIPAVSHPAIIALIAALRSAAHMRKRVAFAIAFSVVRACRFTSLGIPKLLQQSAKESEIEKPRSRLSLFPKTLSIFCMILSAA
jgi:hypothetical protein